jgi:2-pyrone-4,6-dicarboxylate lactonase
MNRSMPVVAPSPPLERPPGLSIDCQVHVYGDPGRYPPRNPKFKLRPQLSYETIAYDDCRRMHESIGMERCVYVQAAAYGADHSYLLKILERTPEDRRRAVAIVDDSVSDAELRRLHEAGVRGARFNFVHFLGLRPTEDAFWRTIDRVRDFGWVIKINALGSEIVELAPMLRKVKDRVVLDHMGLMDGALGVDQPAMNIILDLLRNHENWWIMLSDGHELSPSPAPSDWDEVVPFGRAMYEAAPDRTVWGSDWPHMGWRRHMPAPTGAMVDLLYRYLPDDAARRQVLVDNPSRLFGF